MPLVPSPQAKVRQIVVKEEALEALKLAAQPDVNLIQQFAGELFDLRAQMRAKAAENGLPPMTGGKMGPPPCQDGFVGHDGPRSLHMGAGRDGGREASRFPAAGTPDGVAPLTMACFLHKIDTNLSILGAMRILQARMHPTGDMS